MSVDKVGNNSSNKKVIRRRLLGKVESVGAFGTAFTAVVEALRGGDQAVILAFASLAWFLIWGYNTTQLENLERANPMQADHLAPEKQESPSSDKPRPTPPRNMFRGISDGGNPREIDDRLPKKRGKQGRRKD